MHIINKSARLIDFSFDKKSYRLMPAGEAVEVPNDVMKSAFLKALIKDGSVTETDKPETQKSETEATDQKVSESNKKGKK